MEANKTNQCPKCGATLRFKGHFCFYCGATLQEMAEIPVAPLDETETVDSNEPKEQLNINTVTEAKTEGTGEVASVERSAIEGACTTAEEKTPVDSEKDEAAVPAPQEDERGNPFALGIPKNERSDRDRIRSIWGNALALVLSIVFLLLSFSPVLSMRVAVVANSEISVHVSVADNIMFAVDSCSFLSDQELMQTEEYRELYNSLSPMQRRALQAGDNSVYSGLKKQLILENWETMFRMKLKSSRTPIDVGILLNGVVSVAYVALCVAAIVRSVIHLIYAMKRKERHNSWYNLQYACVAPLALPAVYFLMAITYQFGKNGALSYFAGFSLRCGWGFILALILSVAALIAAVVIRVGIHNSSRKSIRRMAYHATIAVLAVFMVCSAFLPAISLQLKSADAALAKDRVTFGMSDYSVRVLNEAGNYASTPSQAFREQIVGGMHFHALPSNSVSAEEEISSTVSRQVILGRSPIPFHVYYLLVMCATFLLLLAAGYLFWAALLGAAHEECDVRAYGRRRWNLVRAIFIVMPVLLLSVYVIAMVRMFLLSLRFYVDLKLGIGTVASLLASVGVCVLIRKKKARVLFDQDYDNADVSYAPYVLDDTK